MKRKGIGVAKAVGAVLVVVIVAVGVIEVLPFFGGPTISIPGIPEFFNTRSSTPNYVDIYLANKGPPAGLGIVDYGIENRSGQVTPYKETMTGISGTASISSLLAFNSAYHESDAASLQLNAVLSLNTSAGPREYWAQNVVNFNTSKFVLNYDTNLWNVTLPSATLAAPRISGAGSNSQMQPALFTFRNSTEYTRSYYGGVTIPEHYNLPLKITLSIGIIGVTGTDTTIGFAYQEQSGGGGSGSTTVYYENTTISSSASVTGASFLVTGFTRETDLLLRNCPSGVPQSDCVILGGGYYDAEFVFGGQSSGRVTTFTLMNSNLSISYRNASGGSFLPRAVYEFASDTREGTSDLVTSHVSGVFTVKLGTPNFDENYILG